MQTGFGRLRHGLWGFSRHDSALDAVIPELVDAFAAHGRYLNTFGGTAVSIAAARAVLDIINDEGLIDNARVVREHLTAGLGILAGFHEPPGEVRETDPFLGVDLVHANSPDEATTLVVGNELRRRGVLLGVSGAVRNTLKIRPPLCFSLSDTHPFLSELYSALRVARQQARPDHPARSSI